MGRPTLNEYFVMLIVCLKYAKIGFHVCEILQFSALNFDRK